MLKRIIFIILIFSFVINLNSQNDYNKLKFGAYYFDGWDGAPKHLTLELINNKNREPIWGWQTSTYEIVKKQVGLAYNSGLKFFTFCWYHKESENSKIGGNKLNNALKYYIQSQDYSGFEFNIMVVNHGTYSLNKKDWPGLVDYWTELFRQKNYLKVEGRPLIVFYDFNKLIESFGSRRKLNKALKYFRKTVNKKGFSGVSIAISSSILIEIHDELKKTDFDIFTTYNDHSVLLKKQNYRNAIEDEKRSLNFNTNEQLNIWSSNSTLTKLPIIPTITLNWDDSPWKKGKIVPNFGKYSEETIFRSIKLSKEWLKTNKIKLTKERLVLIYSWNEYGEGAWLTPSKDGFNPLSGLKKGI
ncbi:Glycosyltransferase WbsX [Lutibacter agarilyticus]|uniref:Glycosyltransferase WbsX n=1 Tax=Lutibacter agarilyticus TaxID=1109740 RepID=A0A238WTY4_9FLAO|nr:glycoside hydrolase family 99-like domain-containing protein [Lutibacter agarilyticus]SNR49888.1 Glycosyltransferase WbsX [Lutibacter agarilyticus]